MWLQTSERVEAVEKARAAGKVKADVDAAAAAAAAAAAIAAEPPDSVLAGMGLTRSC